MKYAEDFDMEDEKKKVGKGFYVALVVCLLAVCGIAATVFVGSIPKDEPIPQSTTTTTGGQSAQQVVITAPDVPDDRTTLTTTEATTAKAEDLFILPVSNKVLRAFSEVHTYSETLDAWVTHNGVDFAADQKDSVKATADAKVIAIHQDAIWGSVIELQHEGKVITRYCGVTPKGIKEGDTVHGGAVIGTLSELPAEILDASHLHLEMIVNGKYIDPLTVIKGSTVTATATTSSK